MTMKNFLKIIGALLILISASTAYAGRTCDEKQLDARTLLNALELGQKAKSALDTSGAEVALIARVGQDLSKYHLRYSHVGIVWRDHPEGRWTVVHELNQCGSAESSLYNEGLGNFFLDDMFAYETMILIPNAETQTRLASLLASHAALNLHSTHYNMMAYPFSTQYQNSNQWVLELLAAASARDVAIANREQAQAWLKMAGFQPITLNIPATTRLGARMFRANIAFDDHPFDRRMAGKIDTVTVESVVRFIEKRDFDVRKIELSLK